MPVTEYEQAFFSLVLSELYNNYRARHRLNHTEANSDVEYMERIIHGDEKI